VSAMGIRSRAALRHALTPLSFLSRLTSATRRLRVGARSALEGVSVIETHHSLDEDRALLSRCLIDAAATAVLRCPELTRALSSPAADSACPPFGRVLGAMRL
jgi:hypothetical protein